MHNFKQEVLKANTRIRPFIRETPLEYAVTLSHQTATQVFLKCENLQFTGAFKIRGVLNKLLTLTDEQKIQGVVTASAGNHGIAVAYGLNKLHIPGILFIPEKTAPFKIESLHHYGIPIEICKKDAMTTERDAMEYAKRHKMVYVPPCDDFHVICGQGTIANELISQHNQLDAIFVPIGRGGLISGIAGFLKTVMPHIKIIGCLLEKPSTTYPTESSDGTDILSTLPNAVMGNIESGTMIFDFCQKYVDEFITVSNVEMNDAILFALQTQHILIEGAAGLTLAAFIKIADTFLHKNIALILSGANISPGVLKSVLP